MAEALGVGVSLSTVIDLVMKVVKVCSNYLTAEKRNSTCLPNTRVDLLDYLTQWLDESTAKPTMWLKGTPGRGKATTLPYILGRIGEYNTVPRDLKDYSVKAKVGKHHVDALPDTGAQCNLISLQLAEKAGLVPRKGTEQAIRLPTGKQVSSPGAVQVPFSFLGEAKEYMLKCWVIPGCNRDLILSRGFLDATKTLTKFTHRITSTIRKATRRHRLSLLGDERQRIWGGVNNSLALALPDTGSDVMLVSAEYARWNNLNVQQGPEHQLELEFGDGSTAFTAGVVRNAEWAFGDSGQKVRCDFYVLDDLSVDVVLSGDFVFEFGVFDKFSRFLVHLDLLPDSSELYNIRLIGKYSPELLRLEMLCYNDLNSPHAFSARAVKAERVRRDQIRDAINALPLAEQAEAWAAEHRRQELWEGFRAKHRSKQGGMATSSVPSLRTWPGQRQTTRWWERIVGHRKGS